MIFLHLRLYLSATQNMVQNSNWFPRKKEESEERKKKKLLRIVVLNEARLNATNFIIGLEGEKTLRKEKEKQKEKKRKEKVYGTEIPGPYRPWA